MKFILFIAQLFILLSRFKSKLIEKDDIRIINLEKEQNRMNYILNSNQTCKFINSDEKYIYFIELPKGIFAQNSENKTFSELIYLSKLNDYITIDIKNSSDNNISINITSILNEINLLYFNGIYYYNYLGLDKEIIFFVKTEKDTEIVNLDSIEKSLHFYYIKYQYEKVSPKDFYPINKSIFNKYNGDIIHLDKNSVYIFYAELYKLDSVFDVIDLFISQEQINKNFLLNQNILYLKKSEDFYNITFQSSFLKPILKLPKKFNSSEVISSKGEIILNKNNSYYEVTEENIKNGIQLKVNNNDCIIEILSTSKDVAEFLDFNSTSNYKLTKQLTVIKIPKIKSTYDIFITKENKTKSDELHMKYNIQISKKSYFYNTVNPVEGKGYIRFTSLYLYSDELEEDEFIFFHIFLNTDELNNGIYLTYNPSSLFKYLLKEIPEETGQYIVNNITNILDKFYIYKDISKNPPEIKNLKNYHHNPIDIINSFKNISTKNKTYLSLYQEIRKILTSVRDGHLNIKMSNIENKVDFDLAYYCVPFEFYIETRTNFNEIVPIMKIKPNMDCLNKMSKKDIILKFIEKHANIPIKYINKTDPFNYVQNFGHNQLYRNRHAQFTMNLVWVKNFYHAILPFDITDIINIEYEFENGDIINLDYTLVNFSDLDDSEQEEFKQFYNSFIQNVQDEFFIPDIFQLKKLFKQSKGVLLEDSTNSIKWDVETSDGKLKCKVDEKYKYNIFLQTSFSFSSINNALDVMIKCNELFYSNDYKIIGIENRNEGGSLALYIIWNQLIQPKTISKNFFSLINNNDALKYFKDITYFAEFSSIETCEYLSTEQNLGEIIDKYGNNGEIIHKRSKLFDILDKTWRKRLELIRKKNFENKKLKKPTDILIYTDSSCFSAGSGFIKGFQNSGGAIIVGFNGNPKIEGTSEFDGSQSISPVLAFKSQEYYDLYKLGYSVIGITYGETYDDSYQGPNPIPREYTVDLVDRRVPIYGPYSDDLYESFISHATDIFNEFQNKCSKNNKNLLLEDEQCQLDGHKKGGHPCGEDETWDNNNCEAFYCDFGYYYDHYKKECVEDICTKIKNDSEIYINETKHMKEKEISVEPNNELTLHFPLDNYFYFLEGKVDDIFSVVKNDSSSLINCSNLCIIDYVKTNDFDYVVNLNYFKNLKENTKIKITSFEKDPKIKIKRNYNTDYIFLYSYQNFLSQNNLIYVLQFQKEQILDVSSFNKGINVYYSKYNNDLTPSEIINIDTKKFKEISGEIITTEANKTYVLILRSTKDFMSNIFLNILLKDPFEYINVDNEYRFLYLSKQNFNYILRFISITKNFYIKLSNKTLDAEIEILDKNNIILNKENRYYYLNKNTKSLSLRIKTNKPAYIEFLFGHNDLKYLDINQKILHLEKGLNVLRYSQKDKCKSVKVNIESNNSLSLIIYGSIGKNNYLPVFPEEQSFKNISLSSEFDIPYEKLTNDETFNILIKTNTTSILKVEISKDEDNESSNKGLPLWVIILIIICVILFILIVIIIICIIRKKKKKDDEIKIKEDVGLLNFELQ